MNTIKTVTKAIAKDPLQSVKFIFEKLKGAVPMGVFFIIYLMWFNILESANRTHFHVIHVAVDDMIPFCEVFVLPYYAWFFYVILSTVYMYFKDIDMYHRMCTMLVFGMLVFLVVSTVFPTIQLLRPSTMPRDNIFTRMVSLIYAKDTPTNVCPSIHVYNSICVMIAVLKSKGKFCQIKGIRIGSTVLGILICLSTMFIKQHSFFDVVSGLLLSLLAGIAVYRYDLYTGRVRKPRTAYETTRV